MKTPKKHILVASLIAISMMTSLTAQAGFLDWFRTNTAAAEQTNYGSFDSLYASVMNPSPADPEQPTLVANAIAAVSSPAGGVRKVLRRSYVVQVSGYNSEVGQTDDSPFITANGTHVRDGIVAANMLPFGTAIKFKNCGWIDENKIFIVTDRMNKRYQNNVDIWFESHTDAVKFGRRSCQIEVIQ